MNTLEELDSILNSIPPAVEKENFVSFDEIQAIDPMFHKENPATYHLYLTYNGNILSDEEKEKVREIIHRLKCRQSMINKRNLEYMNRHLLCDTKTE